LLASIEVDGATVVARVEETQLATDAAAELHASIEAALPREGARVAIDLSNVEYLDSSALASLVRLLKDVRPSGDVVLYGARDGVAEILRITHLDAVFHCAPSRDEALRHLTQASTGP